jgi:hypothetical protein
MQIYGYLAEFVLDLEIFQTTVVEKIQTHLMSRNFVSGKGDDHAMMYEILYSRTGHATI